MKKINYIPKSVIFSCFLAGGLEMYDFLIFGFLTPVIHKNYLSFLDKDTALVVTYAFFAVGFLFRPLGSIIFGYIGDKYGRKKALVLSVSMMGSASLGLAILPSYDLIGISACYLIVLIRIVQGVSVGGEYSGAILYAIEHINKKNIGFVGGAVLCGCTLGVIGAFLSSKFLQNEQLPEYSWRFAFLIGFGLSIVGYFIRKNLRETPIFIANKVNIKFPLLHGLKTQKLKMLSALLLAGASNANFYFVIVFVPNYLKNNNIDTYFSGLLLITFMFFLVPVVGWLSDKWSRGKIMICSAAMIAVYDLFFLNLLYNNASNTELTILYTWIYAVLLSLLLVVANVFALEVFSVECRFSCGATSYSVGAALFGGTAPVICSLLVESFSNHIPYLSGYISFVSVLGAIGAFILLRFQSNHFMESNNSSNEEFEEGSNAVC